MIEQHPQVPPTIKPLRTTQDWPTLQGLIRPLFRFVFPSACCVCEGPLRGDERKVCSSCWSSIRQVSGTDDIYRDTLSNVSRNVAKLVAPYYFDKDGTLQTIIHELKYNGMTSLGVELGRHVGEQLIDHVLGVEVDGLIAVPLHKTKLRERGFNQTECVCEGIREKTGLPIVSRLLERVRYTQSQTKMNTDERKQNVAEAFRLNPHAKTQIVQRTFVLVDDVITTGATINECAAVLKKAGAKQVIACSVALAS